MISTKIIAVAVVAVVAAAGAGLYLMMDKDPAKYRSSDDTGRLMIYGNANNDDYLDQEDIDALEKMIAGEIPETKYADANLDGKVDQKDLDMVKRMVKREKMTINYDYYYDGKILQGEVKYPIEKAAVVGTNVLVAMKAVGAVGKIACVSGGAIDTTLHSDIVSLPKISNSVFQANAEEVSKYPVSALITLDTASYVPNHADFTAAGINVVRISASDGVESISGVITLGYLFQCEDRANSYAEFCDTILNNIQSRTKDIASADRVTALSVTMTYYVGGTSSDYYAATQLAGARNLADWPDRTKKFMEGEEWLLEPKYQAKYIIHVRGGEEMGYGQRTTDEIKTIWNKYSVYFTAMDAYKSGGYMILNGNMPVPVRMAYMASIFYPDIFGADYGEKMNQEFVDKFVDNLHSSGYDVKNGVFLIKKDMVTG
ncbi:MAG: hypothetical protein LBG62_00795 [Candidatus Methanoplasma sp.]|jgi:ABC-type Fe3+-hydroxamate transport system substrate-binding protein|nr:hypothetical protein [Candidatus Methanoplasma sp.]